MAIRDWPTAERPRERLALQGAAALSDAELLANFAGNLASLAAASTKELARVPGIGPAKAAQLAAALELARRALAGPLKLKDALASPQAVRDWLRLALGNLEHEVFVALWLDAQNRLIASEELFRGTLTQTSVYPREVVKRALAHNHPSGLAEPSRADEVLTSSLKQALALIDVKLLDHFIVTGGAEPLSFAERGLI